MRPHKEINDPNTTRFVFGSDTILSSGCPQMLSDDSMLVLISEQRLCSACTSTMHWVALVVGRLATHCRSHCLVDFVLPVSLSRISVVEDSSLLVQYLVDMALSTDECVVMSTVNISTVCVSALVGKDVP